MTFRNQDFCEHLPRKTIPWCLLGVELFTVKTNPWRTAWLAIGTVEVLRRQLCVGNRVGVPVSRTEYIFCFRRRDSSIRRTWPALRSWCFIIIASLLVVLASSNTLFVVRLSCHFFSRIHLTLWSWNFSRNVMLWLQVNQLSKAYRIVGSTMALHTFELWLDTSYNADNGSLVSRASLLPSSRGRKEERPWEWGSVNMWWLKNRELGKSHLTSPLASHNLLVIPYLPSRANYFIDW